MRSRSPAVLHSTVLEVSIHGPDTLKYYCVSYVDDWTKWTVRTVSYLTESISEDSKLSTDV
jgi:hypothetical protein